jgi:hypothetical protein
MRAYVILMPKDKPKASEAQGKTVRLNLTVSESLEREFRETVFKRFGLHKGDIQRAVEEALKLWITKGV